MPGIPTLYTKVILVRDATVTNLFGKDVELEIDAAYKIGRSVAVLQEGTIIGHLERRAARVVWRHLRNSTSPMKGEIYEGVGSFKNDRWFSVLTHSFEVGVKIRFPEKCREDARLLLAHIARRKLNSFAGLEIEKCPTDLLPLVRPFEDENGVASVHLV